MKIYDISVIVSEKMHIFPGDPALGIDKLDKTAEEKSVSISVIKMGSHTGTHIDPPLHFIKNSRGIDKIPLDRFVGKAKVLDLQDIVTKIAKKDLERFDEKLTKGDIVLLKTKNSEMWDEEGFQKGFVYLTPEAAHYLIKKGIKTVGIDYLSIEKFGSKNALTHYQLLESDVPIIEGLNLQHIAPGEYFFVCLPLKIENGDGGPARAILIEDM